MNFQKISIEIINHRTFCKAQTVSCFTKIIQPSPIPSQPDETLLRLWNKNYLKEIFRNIQTFSFKVLQECSSWPSRNGASQYFFLTPNRNMIVGKVVKSERSLAVLWEPIIFNVNWVEVRKMSDLFWAKLYCKTCD